MAEILGLGLSHFGGFMFPDGDMASRIKARLADGTLPESLDHPSKWPQAMQAEWGKDEGAGFAARHKWEYFAALDRVRAALDDFRPDAVVIFGDDQYECFREDLVPPYCVFMGESFSLKPYARARAIGGEQTNIWGDPFDTDIDIKGSPDIARFLLEALYGAGFDAAYSYRMPHQGHLGHAFANTLMYLDHRRTGWRYPVIPFAINAYGSALIRVKGGLADEARSDEAARRLPDPPAPSPARCFDLGQALARALKPSPWRIALIATASFSHAFLTAKNHFFYPDMESDRARFAELASGDYATWRALDPVTLESCGQHELVNWSPVVGAMAELGQKPEYCVLLESWLMNSNKCVTVIPPS